MLNGEIMHMSKYFKIYDLVSKNLYESYLEKNLWQVFDERAILTLDMLWEQYGKFVINDWKNGGEYQFRGLRLSEDLFDQHRLGKAFICKFYNVPTFVVKQDTINYKYECFRYITTIGSDIFSYYFDTRNNKDGLTVLKLENENRGESLKYE